MERRKKNLFTEHELFCLPPTHTPLHPHFQLYKIRPKRTRPQALLFLCMILLLIVLHTSYMIYSLASQYVMYGSQKYVPQVSSDSSVSSTPPLPIVIKTVWLLLDPVWGRCRVWARMACLASETASKQRS